MAAKKNIIIISSKLNTNQKIINFESYGNIIKAEPGTLYNISINDTILTPNNATFIKQKGRIIIKDENGNDVIILDYGKDDSSSHLHVSDGWCSLDPAVSADNANSAATATSSSLSSPPSGGAAESSTPITTESSTSAAHLDAATDTGFSLGSKILAGAALLGAGVGTILAGSGGGDSSSPSPSPPSSYTISGSFMAGPVVSGDRLTATAYDASGNALGTSTVGSDGKYHINISNGYKGNILVVVTDNNPSQPDYFDEASGEAVNLSAPLRAITSVDGATSVTGNVTPLTELVVRQLNVSSTTVGSVESSKISTMNTAIAKLFDLGSVDVTTLTPESVITGTGDANAAANAYGKMLALLSGVGDGDLDSSVKFLEANTVLTNGVLTWKADSLVIVEQTLANAAVVVAQKTGVSASELLKGLENTDVAPPSAPIVSLHQDTGAGDSVTSKGDIDVSGLLTGGSWEYSIAGSSWVQGSGSGIASSVFDDGTHSVQVRQTDVNNKISAPTVLIFTLDTAAAAPTLALASDTGSSGTDNITTNGVVNVTGLEDGAAWQYSVDNGNTWTTGSDGKIAATVFHEGVNTVQVKQTDKAGNVSSPGSLTFTIDTIAAPPSLTLANDTGSSNSDKITNNGVVNVTGLEDGATWQYSVNGGEWTNGSGSSIAASAFTADKEYTVQVKQTDKAGNVSSAGSLTFTLDTVAAPPSLTLANDTGSSNSDKITSNGVVNVTGLEDGATWQYSVNGGAWTNGSGASIAASVFATDKEYTVQVKQTDKAGNVSSPSSLTFTLDTVANAPSLTLANDTGSSNSDKITNNGGVNVTGLEDGATWQYSVDGGEWTNGSGASIAASAFAANQVNTMQVKQTDKAGNVSSPGSLTFTLDTVANAPSLTLASDTGSSNNDKITSNGVVNVTGLEDGATWQYSVNGGAWTNGSGASIAASAFTADKEYIVQVKQTDKAGNVSSEGSLTFTLDTVAAPPSLTLASDTGSSNSDKITSNGVVNVTGLEDGATWQYSVDGGNHWINGSGASIAASAFTADKEYTVQVKQTDKAGNVSSLGSLTFTLDTVKPVFSEVSVTWGDVLDSAEAKADGKVTITTSGLEDGQSVLLKLNGHDCIGTVKGNTVTFNISKDYLTELQDGQTYSLIFNTSDKAGNAADSYTKEFWVDFRTPAIMVNDITDDNVINAIEADGKVAVTGTVGNCKAGDAVTLTVNGNELHGTVADDNTSFSISVNGSDLAADSDKILQAKVVTIVSGTSKIATKDHSYTVDTIVPNPPIIALASDTGSSNSDKITSNGVVNVTGLEDGATWQYSVNGGEWTNGSGSSIAASAFTADKEYTVQVKQTDKAGNVSSAGSLTFTLDTVANAPSLTLASDTGSSNIDKITSNGVVNVTGLEDGATWQYSVNGGEWTNGSGSSIAASVFATDKEYTVQVKQTDKAGNVSSPSSLTFTLDTVANAPSMTLAGDTGSSNSDKITSNGGVNVTGLEVGATWQYSVDGGAWTNGSGASIAATVFHEGVNTVQVKQTDKAGNVSSPGSLTFTIDTVANAPSLTLASDTGSSNSDKITSNGGVNVTGLEAGATWQYSVDGGAWTNGSGASIAATVFHEGVNTVQVKQTDKAGNDSSPSSLTFTIDTVANAPSLTLASDTGSSNSDKITNNGVVNVTGLEDGATWQYSVDGGAWTNGNGASIAASVFATDKEYTVQVKQTDKAGNVSSPSSLTFTLDTVANAPSLTLASDTGSSNSDKITSNGGVNVTGLEVGATWQYSVDGGAWTNGSGASIAATVFHEGVNTVQVKQTDKAGNVSSAGSLTFTIDTIAAPPSLTMASDTGSSNSDKITSNGGVNITGLEDGATWQYSVNGGAWTNGSGASIAASAFTADKEYTVQVKQTDKAGNVSSSGSLTFTLDTVANAPSLTLASDTGSSNSDKITSNGVVNVTGLEDGATWQYSVDGGNHWINGSGASIAASAFTTNQVNTVQVKQTDKAGNVSSAGSLTFTLDTVAAPPSLTLASDTGASNSDKITNNGAVNVTGLEDGATWQYSVDGGNHWIDGSGASIAASAFAANQVNTVQVKQTDKAGNVSSPGSLTFTLDTVANAPSLTLASDTGSSSSDKITSNGVVNVTGLEDGATWQYSPTTAASM